VQTNWVCLSGNQRFCKNDSDSILESLTVTRVESKSPKIMALVTLSLVATVHSRGQAKPQGGTAPPASGNIQDLAQRSAVAASERHSGRLRNSNLSEGYSTDVTTYAPLPSFLKSARKPRISTHGARRHGLPSLKHHSLSGSSSIS